MTSRLVIILLLPSLFSTFTFSKHLLIEVEDEGAAGEDDGAAGGDEGSAGGDEGGADEEEGTAGDDIEPEVDGEDYAPPAGPPPINPGGDFGRK